MSLTDDQQVCLKFCYKTGKTSTETFHHFQTVYGNDSVSHTTCLEYFQRLSSTNQNLTNMEIAKEMETPYASWQRILANKHSVVEAVIKQEPLTKQDVDNITAERVIKQEPVEEKDRCNIFHTEIKEEPTDENGRITESLEIKEEPQTTASFICGVCNFKFKWKYGLKRHMVRHTKNRIDFICQICDTVFVNKFNLDRHLRSHTGEKPYECNSCDFKTGDRSNFLRHLRNHLGKKPFNCSLCDYRSAERSKLYRHMKIHSRKTLACEICNFKCAYKNALAKHLRKAHTKEFHNI